jgi:hypothetical protein
MSVTLAQLAIEVAADMVSHAWTPDFYVARSHLPRADAKDLAVPRATVRPAAFAAEITSRTGIDRTLRVDVAIQKLITAAAGSAAETLELDGMADLADSIAAFWLGRSPAALPTAQCFAVASEFLADHLANEHVCTTVVSLQFQVAE